MALELVKENIEYEQLLGENTADNVIKAEYVIPDTLPDVSEILMLDAKPSIISAEVMQDKVYLEGQIAYNVLYLAKEETSEVFSVPYIGKFSNYIEVSGAAHKMLCETECFIEHMECNIVNERKIAIEGIIKLNSRVKNNYAFDIVKDIHSASDVQLLKNPTSIDKIIGLASGNITAKSHLVVPMDKAQIGTILGLDTCIHKKDMKIMDGKVQAEAFILVEVLYKGRESRDVEKLADDILVRQELDIEGANSAMECFGDFSIENVEYDVKMDDLGENRIIDIEIGGKVDIRVMSKETIDVIEDAYSPAMILNMNKNNYELNVVHGSSSCETIVKDDINLASDSPKPVKVIYTKGNVNITDKKLVENKAIIEGLLNVCILYTTDNEDKYVDSVSEEIPFTSSIDVPGAKIDMSCIGKLKVESLEAVVEGGVIAVKAVINAFANVSYISHKDFLVDIEQEEGSIPQKKASITIYVVQPGDTIWKIAKKYSTAMDTLVKINNLEDDNINIGEKLLIPGRAVL